MLTIPHYPKATAQRLHGRDKTVVGARRNVLKMALINLAILQVLFFLLFCYLFGSIFQQSSHVHNMHVLYVDYDGGLIGSAVRQAYGTLQGKGFPTLNEASVTQYPTSGDIEKDVCSTKYWAAIYTSAGATTRLEQALAGGSAATRYNRSDVLTYIWNEARYSAVVDSDISVNLQLLTSTARVAYTSANGTGAMSILASTDPAAISVFANPWQLASVDIQPTTQGARLIYNTLTIILILIQEFFYLGVINGLYAKFKIYERLFPHRIILYRNMISLTYTFVGSLSTTGAIWAFKDGWRENGHQFVLTWMILWLFAHANFLSLDMFTVWVPPQFAPMVLITWVVLNVASILIPFDLSPGFYKWAYVIPAHEVYQVLNDIWSGGCNPQLHYALPILFALEIIGLVLSALGVYRRCHYALVADEAQKRQFQERLDIAMDFERKRDAERKAMQVEETPEEAEKAQAADRKELGEDIRREDTKIAKEKAKGTKTCSFGPSFDLAFDESKTSLVTHGGES